MIWPGFARSVRNWEDKILGWAEKYNLDPNLVALVMQLESMGAKCASSSSGALGLFQVMPYHFGDDLPNACNPSVNAHYGLRYLRTSYELANGDISRTLAGYNGGHGVINWDQENWYAETQLYVSKGMKLWKGYQEWKNK